MNQKLLKQEYLKLLSKQYPTISKVSSEIINQSAMLNLPKGTEHFVSDIHGEDEAFNHVLKNGSGSIKIKIDEVFESSLLEKEKRVLATLIYYPRKKLAMLLDNVPEEDRDEWLAVILFRLVKMCRYAAVKYTRSMIREAINSEFTHIIEELLHEQEALDNKHDYYQSIIETIISTGRAEAFVVALSELIQRMVVSHLHVIGDIFDRGAGAHTIMDRLMSYHNVDIQWGNHDIVWMGAAAGSYACIANVIRVSLRYGNMETLENGYGISMLPLASFSMDIYGDDPCTEFETKASDDSSLSTREKLILTRMHKAITIIQLKLEGQVIKRRPEYKMEDRLILDKIDIPNKKVTIDGVVCNLKDCNFPTIDPENPYALTNEEKAVVRKLQSSFVYSDRLQEHVRFLFSKGSVYKIHNNNLLYHGCILMNDDMSFTRKVIDGKELAPKDYLDYADRIARQGYFSNNSIERQVGQDMMWYLWKGKESPLFGKEKMATFERYFTTNKDLYAEKKNPYYKFRDNEDVCINILKEFGLGPEAHIINGHVPVAVKKGESPVKANGRLIVIDGGFSKAYQKETGIAGYTLVSNSWGFILASHMAFESTQSAIEHDQDIHTSKMILERSAKRIMIKDTDQGKTILKHIDVLNELLLAYRRGDIKERG
ncbi:MAG: fructose-1,6-bisphosphatase [Spirochaetales bacterium]|nr:fructose-1,6-bisphosphatase [Spirochaetales bacterium]